MKIMFCGKIGSGKTFASLLIQTQYDDVQKFAFADPIKDFLSFAYCKYMNVDQANLEKLQKVKNKLFVINKEGVIPFTDKALLTRCIRLACMEYEIHVKHAEGLAKLIHGSKTSREIMQLTGTEWGRKQIDEGIWIRLLSTSIGNAKHFVIDDVRFPNEHDWFTKTFEEGLIIKIATDKPAASKHTGHESEQHYDSLPYDHLVLNNFDDKFGKSIIDVVSQAG